VAKPRYGAGYAWRHRCREAHRFASIAAGEPTQRFAYPDLLKWEPPRTQADACGLAEGRLAVAGLGWCEPLSANEDADNRGNTWQWMKTDYGQALLVKQRRKVQSLRVGSWPARRVVLDVHTRFIPDADAPDPAVSDRGLADDVSRGGHREQLSFDDTKSVDTQIAEREENAARLQVPRQSALGSSRLKDGEVDVDTVLEWVARRHFSQDALGYALRRLAEAGSLEQVVAFSVAVHAAARRSRSTDSES